jgi:hypothetical protein
MLALVIQPVFKMHNLVLEVNVGLGHLLGLSAIGLDFCFLLAAGVKNSCSRNKHSS